MDHGAGQLDPTLVLLVQAATLLVVARLFGEVARRLGQPAVVGEILAGVALGPSLLGALVPSTTAWLPSASGPGLSSLAVLQLLGAIFLLLLTGLETDLQLIRAHARTAASVSLGGISVTFATGFLLATWLPDVLVGDPDRRFVFQLFVATSMSVSAIPVVAKVLMDLGLMRRTIGQTILASGMIDDAVAWTLLSIVLGVAQDGSVSPMDLGWQASKIVLLVVVAGTVGRWVLGGLLRWVQDRMGGPSRLLSLIVACALGAGAITHALGVEAVLGAFIVGVVFGSLPRLPGQVRHQLETMTIGVFAPLFFATAGLRVDLGAILGADVRWMALAVLGVAIAGKVVGTYVGARWIAGTDRWTALAFGSGLNARGAVEIIIASIGLSAGILAPPMYAIIVMVAVVTSVLAPFGLRYTLARVDIGQEEAQRLRREVLEERSILATARRVLVPVRLRPAGEPVDGVKGLESHLLAWMPAHLSVTLLTVVTSEDERARAQAFLAALGRSLGKADLSRRVVVSTSVVDVLLDEARRDYDLVVLGVGAPRTGEPVFNAVLDRLVRLAPCPVLLAHGQPPAGLWRPTRLLVPTNGTQAALRAAETAFYLAGKLGPGASVTVLHAVRRDANEPGSARSELRAQAALAQATDIVHHVRDIGEALGVVVIPDVRVGEDHADLIVSEARLRRVDLVVLGTDVRPGGERLHLGERVERVLADVDCPVLVVNG